MTRICLLPAVVCCFAAAPAAAQSAAGGSASVIVSAATIDGRASVGITGEIAYRLNRMVALGVELTRVPSYEPEAPDEGPPAVPVIAGGIIVSPPTYSISGEEGRATLFTANLRLEIPTGSRRLAPYLIGGAGTTNLHEEFTVTISYPRPILRPLPGSPVTTIFPPSSSFEVRRSSTDMTATLGGGLAVLLDEHLSIDADLRYLAVLGPRDLNIGRFGLGISYRF